jgi:hypothetical protein
MLYIPRIETLFNPSLGPASQGLYKQIIEETLYKIIPADFFSEGPLAAQIDRFLELLPLITSISSGDGPWNLSFYVLTKSRFNVFKFFFEMINRWLVPGEKLNVTMVYGVDFQLPEINQEIYTLCEVMIRVDSQEQLRKLLENLNTIQTEIKLGLKSSFYARKILECKGMPIDEKIIAIQEHSAALIHRLPKAFDIDLLSAMQQTLLLCCTEFKKTRTARHLAKIIAIHHLFKKALIAAIKELPSRRHMFLKTFISEQQIKNEISTILCLLIGINFIRDKEIIERTHILQAVQECIPNALPIDEAFILNRQTDSFALLYIEIQKSDLERFTQEEMLLLKDKLPRALTERIQHLVHPVFMPRNEEEVMRNIISLSNEIRSTEDLPQVIINFHEQTNSNLSFTILIVRIAPPGGQTIQEKFSNAHPQVMFIHDRIKMIGLVRKKQTKEATVCYVKIPKTPFLRLDHSLDLYKARQEIAELLYTAIGEFRDFNGGMIRKQSELLEQFTALLANGVKYSKLLLETFFFSLTPPMMQTTLEAEALTILFSMLLNAIESGFPNNNCHRIRQDLNFIFLLVKAESQQEIDDLERGLKSQCICATELAQTSVCVDDIRYHGYIYRCTEPTRQQQFLSEAHLHLSRHMVNVE